MAVWADSGSDNAKATASPPLRPPHIRIRVVLGVMVARLLMRYMGIVMVIIRLSSAKVILLAMMLSVR